MHVYMCVYICIYICAYIYTCILFNILFHYGLPWDIEYSALCDAVGPCCLSILYMMSFIS